MGGCGSTQSADVSLTRAGAATQDAELWEAVEQDDVERATKLIDSGALTNYPSALNTAPTQSAGRKPEPHWTRKLQAVQRYSWTESKAGMSRQHGLLHAAAERGNQAMVDLLLAHGASRFLGDKSEQGETPIEVARRCQHGSLADHMARIEQKATGVEAVQLVEEAPDQPRQPKPTAREEAGAPEDAGPNADLANALAHYDNASGAEVIAAACNLAEAVRSLLSPSALIAPAQPSVPPGRVRHTFKKWDADKNGSLSLAELQAGFESEFGKELAPHAKDAIPTLFEKHAKVDEAGEQSLNVTVFNRFYAEILFKHFDASNDGKLQLAEAQEALAFLVKPSADGGKPNVSMAYPPDAYDETGALALPKSWFLSMYQAME